jgi:endonuclease/exonuclease/phosphatase family metal-dependent hydrolase
MQMQIMKFALIVAALSVVEPTLGRTIRVLTYNIHHGAGTDSVIDLQRIANVISSADPDIVALQEVDQGTSRSSPPRGPRVFQLDRLAELTGFQGYFGKAINYDGGEYGNAVLISPNLRIVHTTNRPLPNPAGGEARALIEVDLSLDSMDSTADFTFFATHFDHASETNRLAQADFVNMLVDGSTSPALLAGDLNSRPSTLPFQRILQQWTDTTNLVDPGINRTFQLDYVLYRLPDQWELVENGRFIVNSTTQVASDHFPFLAVVELVPEPCSSVMALFGLLMASGMRRSTNGGATSRTRAGTHGADAQIW